MRSHDRESRRIKGVTMPRDDDLQHDRRLVPVVGQIDQQHRETSGLLRAFDQAVSKMGRLVEAFTASLFVQPI